MKLKFTLMVLLTALTAKAQEDRKPWMGLENRIGMALGIGSVTYLDKNSSPLIYQSKPKSIRLFYNLESNHMLFSVDFDARIGSTGAKHHRDRTLYFQEEDYKGKKEEKKFPVGGSFLSGRVSLGAFYKIKSTQQSTFKAAAGLRISNSAFYPQGWTSAGIMNALSLSPEGLVQHRVDAHHSFGASVRIPLLSHLTRLPYANSVSYPNETKAGGFLKNGKWVGVRQLLAPAFTVDYDYEFNQRYGAGLNYEFSWYNVATPNLMRMTTQSLSAKIYHQL